MIVNKTRVPPLKQQPKPLRSVSFFGFSFQAFNFKMRDYEMVFYLSVFQVSRHAGEAHSADSVSIRSRQLHKSHDVDVRKESIGSGTTRLFNTPVL